MYSCIADTPIPILLHQATDDNLIHVASHVDACSNESMTGWGYVWSLCVRMLQHCCYVNQCDEMH